MKIKAIPADQLTPVQLQAWDRLQRADPAIDNPMLRPEFTQVVASVRQDVEVAVMENNDEPVGFLPFQRDRNDVALPVASIMSDMHGVAIDRDVDFCPKELLRQCHLSAWKFDHLIASQKPFQPHHCCLEDSPFIDLTDGYEEYIQQRKRAGCSSISQAKRKARKLQRDIGPLRFESHTTDSEVFAQLIAWKQQQLVQMNYADVFRFDWVIELLEAVRRYRSDRFSGMLSALYAGDNLVAVHLGMRGDAVISSWIPTFNPQYAKYSPGLLIHLELARTTAETGVRRIDLGRGYNRLKKSLMSGSIAVALGAVDGRPINRTLRAGWYRMRGIARSSSLAKRPLQMFRRMRSWMSVG